MIATTAPAAPAETVVGRMEQAAEALRRADILGATTLGDAADIMESAIGICALLEAAYVDVDDAGQEGCLAGRRGAYLARAFSGIGHLVGLALVLHEGGR